jgi:L-2-hydroxyglutarate oxidase LhgO
VHFSVTPGKGEYGIFEIVTGDECDVNAMVVPLPTKSFAGVYTFKSVYNNVIVGPTNVRQVQLHNTGTSNWIKVLCDVF